MSAATFMQAPPWADDIRVIVAVWKLDIDCATKLELQIDAAGETHAVSLNRHDAGALRDELDRLLGLTEY